jgi:hypothetical protein
MYGEIKKNKQGDTIIYDRCLLDNLIYTLWSYRYNPGSIDGKFVDETIDMVKESMRNLDMIFYIPADKCNFGVVNDSFRDTNLTYRKEIDQLFKMLIGEYNENFDKYKQIVYQHNSKHYDLITIEEKPIYNIDHYDFQTVLCPVINELLTNKRRLNSDKLMNNILIMQNITKEYMNKIK